MKIQQSTIFSVKCGFASFIATYIAGIMHPLDVLKTRFQSHDGKSSIDNQVPKYQGVFKGLKQIYANQGLRGLFKGFYISLISQAMATAFFFLLYQKRKIYYQNKGQVLMKAVTYSSIQASIIATLFTQPLWVIKTRMLLNTNKDIGQFEHAVLKSKQIYRQNGLKGFLKGLGVSLILSFNGVLQMYTYQATKLLYQKFKIPQTPIAQKSFVCGSLSKMISVLVTYPLTTIRTRIQQNQFFNNRAEAKYSSVFDVIGKMIRDQGIHGFYKGLVPNLIKGIPQRGIYFYSYQIIKNIFCEQSTNMKVRHQ